MRSILTWLTIVSVVGVVAMALLGFFNNDYRAYGEVPIPGSGRLHLPAGDVQVSFHAGVPGANGGDNIDEVSIPQNLELVVRASDGSAQPSVSDDRGGTTGRNDDAYRRIKVVHIPADGDYTITTNGGPLTYKLDGKDRPYVNPRLAFGHGNIYKYLLWAFVGLTVLGTSGGIRNRLRPGGRRGKGRMLSSPPSMSSAELLASGQRVLGILKSRDSTGVTMRSMGITPSRPELLDAPMYALEVELHLPNEAPTLCRSVQPVPPDKVSALVVGMELKCAVNLADPTRFVVDWR